MGKRNKVRYANRKCKVLAQKELEVGGFPIKVILFEYNPKFADGEIRSYVKATAKIDRPKYRELLKLYWQNRRK